MPQDYEYEMDLTSKCFSCGILILGLAAVILFFCSILPETQVIKAVYPLVAFFGGSVGIVALHNLKYLLGESKD